MSKIRIDLAGPVIDGQVATFRSPADCSAITGLIVYYPHNGDTISKIFQFADAHGNNVGSTDLFAESVLVRVILDTELNRAYVQNADTNAYLEGKFSRKQNKLGWVTDEDIDAMFEGTYVGTEDEDPEGNGYVSQISAKIENGVLYLIEEE